MSQSSFNRKLTTIFSADAAGYSRLMGADEEATVQTIELYRKIMSDLITQHRGHVIDSPGDNLLAEFASVVDAVQCAVAVQKELQARNSELPEDRKMHFRIGINLGDVIQEGERLYGDGVNIAARLEGLAEPGGICISRTAFEHIESKLPYGYDYIGDQAVKNISKPVGVYRVSMEPRVTIGGKISAEKLSPLRHRPVLLGGTAAMLLIAVAVGIWQFYVRLPSVEPASMERMAYPLPEKPSIAVLPFNNLSGDPSKEYLGDCITENIITALSKIPEMFVISRTSTDTYKGRSVKTQQVSEELGVRYVLEGSIQKADNRIRVTAQLIDAITGLHLWADRYDRNINDFFNLLDEIAQKVAIELQVKLTEGDIARISHRTENYSSWAYATQAYSLIKRLNKQDNAKARKLSEKAIELDPEYGFAWATLGAAHNVDAIFGWGTSRAESLKLSIEYTEKALKLDESLSCAAAVKGRILRIQRRFDEAIAAGEKAIALSPSHDLPYITLSYTMCYAGRFEESIALAKKAMRLNPNYPAYYTAILVQNYFFTKRYEEAVELGKQVLERAQKGEYTPVFAHLGLSIAYMKLGKEKEARAHAEEILKTDPNFSVEVASKALQYKNQSDFKQIADALLMAGIPEHSSSQ